MTNINPEHETGSHEKGDLRMESYEPSGIEAVESDMAGDARYANKGDYNGLSPITRKSERERKNISYDKLNKGAPDSDDDG
jgi:hypothetical protein